MQRFAGQRVDKYELVERLAQGGMGSVWRARHVELDVDRALKFPRFDGVIGESTLRRFRREARAAARLKSRHAAHVYDYGVDAGLPFFVMELLDGEDLGTRLQRVGRLDPVRALGLIADAARGLKDAHALGLVHRDVKPSNLFIARQDDEEIVKLVDFGIALVQQTNDSPTETTGQAFGSPAYMSPEQARGDTVDARSDLWSLAAVAYRALTGQLPFDGASSGDIIVKICTRAPPPLGEHGVDLPDDFQRFFERGLARRRADRFESAAALLKELDTLAALPTTRNSFPAIAAAQPRESETEPIELQRSVAPPASSKPRRSAEVSRASRRQLHKKAALLLVGLAAFAALLRKPNSAVDDSHTHNGSGHEARRQVTRGDAALQVEAGGRNGTALPDDTALPEDSALPDEPASRRQGASKPTPEPNRASSPSAAPPTREASQDSARARDSDSTGRRHEASEDPPTQTDPIFGIPLPSSD